MMRHSNKMKPKPHRAKIKSNSWRGINLDSGRRGQVPPLRAPGQTIHNKYSIHQASSTSQEIPTAPARESESETKTSNKDHLSPSPPPPPVTHHHGQEINAKHNRRGAPKPVHQEPGGHEHNHHVDPVVHQHGLNLHPLGRLFNTCSRPRPGSPVAGPITTAELHLHAGYIFCAIFARR